MSFSLILDIAYKYYLVYMIEILFVLKKYPLNLLCNFKSRIIKANLS